MIRVFATVLGVLAFGVAVAGLASRYLPIGNEGVLVVAAASPYLAEQAGAGLSRTYPSRPWRRPMIGIDHVLLYNCAATSALTVSVPASDHRGLATTIDLPVDLTAS
jgi:endonuclease/exonuclease/phosphatase family metal-dependent hydrolase